VRSRTASVGSARGSKSARRSRSQTSGASGVAMPRHGPPASRSPHVRGRRFPPPCAFDRDSSRGDLGGGETEARQPEAGHERRAGRTSRAGAAPKRCTKEPAACSVLPVRIGSERRQARQRRDVFQSEIHGAPSWTASRQTVFSPPRRDVREHLAEEADDRLPSRERLHLGVNSAGWARRSVRTAIRTRSSKARVSRSRRDAGTNTRRLVTEDASPRSRRARRPTHSCRNAADSGRVEARNGEARPSSRHLAHYAGKERHEGLSPPRRKRPPQTPTGSPCTVSPDACDESRRSRA